MILIRAAKIIQNAELQSVYLFFSVCQLADLHNVKQAFFRNFSGLQPLADGCSIIHIAKTISPSNSMYCTKIVW